MPLRLITGPANAGKTGVVLREALGAARGTSPVIVVPSLADVRRLEIELSGKAPLGIRVVTLRQLLNDLWGLHGDGRRVVDDPTRRELLRAVLSRGAPAEVASASETPGFRRLLTRLAAKSVGVRATRSGRQGAAGAIDSIIDAYVGELKSAGLVESGWLPGLVAEIAPNVGGSVGLARFDMLQLRYLELVVGLARTNPVTVALTWEAGFAPTRENNRSVEYLHALAEEHITLAEGQASGEIQRLARRLYTGPAAETSGGEILTGLASGGEAEAALIARFVAEQIAGGTAAERILVSFQDVSRRMSETDNALLSYGISADFEATIAFMSTHFGRAWCALMSLASGRGGREEALTYLSSPYSAASRGMVQDLDRHWRVHRIVSSRALVDSIRGSGPSTERAIRAAEALVSAGLNRGTSTKWQKLADCLLEAAVAEEAGKGLGPITAEDVAAHQSLVRALAEMARHSDESLPVADVLAACDDIRVHIGGEESAGRVQVCEFGRVGARRFDVVVLGGLTESELATAPRDSLESELSLDSSSGLESDPADRLRLQFYSLITRARHKLFLVRQEADSEGRERRAAGLWEDALDAYRPIGASADDHAASPPPCVMLARSDVEVLAPALTVGRRSKRAAAGSLRFREPERSTVTGIQGLTALSHATLFSATEIETYLECPYKWFYQRVVRPEEIDRVLDSRELGTRAHGLLAAFYRRLAADAKHSRVTTEWLGEALQLFDAVALEKNLQWASAGGLSEELAAARAIEWARNVIGQDALLLPGFVPEFAEFCFGEDGGFEFGGHALHGRIDRVDTSDASVFVTDYKSSREVTGIAKLEVEGKVQALIYARAAEQALGRPVSGSVYRSMRSGRLRGFWRCDLLGNMPQGMCEDDAISGDDYRVAVARTEERVAAAIAGMRAGVVPRVPTVKGACAYCALSATCEGART